MSFWTSEKILHKQAVTVLIAPFHQERVKHGAYELALGGEVLITNEGNGTKRELKDGEQLVIPPGQFGLLLTNERISIPDNAIGFISIRFGIKCQGLVNVSGFHVDPGFVGHLKFAVYNAGSQSVFLSRGDPVFMIWFSDLSAPTRDLYDGEHRNQDGITSNDARMLHGDVASPAALKKQIEELRSNLDQRLSTLDDKIVTWRTVTITLLSAILVLILGTAFGWFTKFLPAASAPSNQSVEAPRQLEPSKNSNQASGGLPDKNGNSSGNPDDENANSPARRR